MRQPLEDDDNGDGFVPQLDKPELVEYAFKHALKWEDITSIKEYMYPDDWKTHKGPKFYVGLDGKAEDILVLGNFFSMLQHWREFRNRYPLHTE